MKRNNFLNKIREHTPLKTKERVWSYAESQIKKHDKMKKAVLVTISLITRVIVDENATDEEIVESAKDSFKNKIDNNELVENLENIKDDDDVPFGTLDSDKYYQPDFDGDDTLITPDGVELWSYYVYSSKELAQEDFPDRNILEYSGDDIENPYFVK